MPKDAYWFSHDSNARNDPAVLMMRSKYKAEGYGWFWILVEMMREQSDYRLSHSLVNGYAMQCQCQPIKAEQFLAYCIACGLFQSDGEFFWSNSLIRRMEGKDRRVESGREAALKRWGKERESVPNANPLPTQCQPDAIREDKKREEKIIGDKKPLTGGAGGKPPLTETEDFQTFWACYPRKVAKPVALKAWQKLNPDRELYGKIIHGLSRAKLSDQWTRDGGAFVPHPATFLNQRRWEDDYKAGNRNTDKDFSDRNFQNQNDYSPEDFKRMREDITTLRPEDI